MEAIKYEIAYKSHNSTKGKDVKKGSPYIRGKIMFLTIYNSKLKTIFFLFKENCQGRNDLCSIPAFSITVCLFSVKIM